MQWFFPLNKNLWSSSFTLFMGGIGMISLAAFSYYFDVKQSRYTFKFAQVFGVNSIFAYTMSSLLTVIFYSSNSFKRSYFTWYRSYVAIIFFSPFNIIRNYNLKEHSALTLVKKNNEIIITEKSYYYVHFIN